ncbi:hypothetical protein CHS0354_027249 [Potamilus streckersoni]|uniref:Uncharacterized protein n=1 Tax=Potamilus streckersoni TaxID=2493646 RepID=A0AAE0RYB2_9BIVA|nr:hypothetical protein CHS0354_027249 [Potamilus streckersoni]
MIVDVAPQNAAIKSSVDFVDEPCLNVYGGRLNLNNKFFGVGDTVDLVDVANKACVDRATSLGVVDVTVPLNGPLETLIWQEPIAPSFMFMASFGVQLAAYRFAMVGGGDGIANPSDEFYVSLAMLAESLNPEVQNRMTTPLS